MKDILDQEYVDVVKKKKVIFTILSFINSFVLTLLLIRISKGYIVYSIELGLRRAPLYMIHVFYLSLITGLIFTYLSFRKEEVKFVKWIGAIISVILLLFSAVFIFYTYTIDLELQ